MQSKNRRVNQAVRLAQAADLGRISYALTWGAFGGPPRGVSKRAARVLLLFCAANRCGKMGYRGIRAALWAVAAAVSRCSGGEAASPSTVRRGLHELVEAGLLVSAVYGGGAPRLVACGDGESHWIRDQQVAYTVTAAGLACWSWSRESAAAERRAVGNGGPVSCDSVGVPKCESNKRIEGFSISSFLGDFENTPAGGACVSDHCPSSEHLGAEPPRSAAASSPARCGSPDSNEARRDASRGFAAGAVPGEARRVGPQKRGQELASKRGQFKKPRPLVPVEVRREIEAALVTECAGLGRAGRLWLGAATLALADPSSWAGSPLPWWHWVKLWPRLTRAERLHLVRSEIRPGLGAELERRVVQVESGKSGKQDITRETNKPAISDKSGEAVTIQEGLDGNPELVEIMEKILGRKLKPE